MGFVTMPLAVADELNDAELRMTFRIGEALILPTNVLPYLSPRGAACALGLSTSRVRQLAAAGKVRECRDLAGRRLYAYDDVMRFKEQRAISGLVGTR